MRSFLLNKLIRDKVLINMQELGQQIKYRKLNDGEFLHELQRKLLEEAGEFDPTDPKAMDELADVLEVLETLARELGENFDSLRNRQLNRRQKRGAFLNRIYIERLDLEDDDPWTEYYAKDSKRFPPAKSQ